MPRTFHSVEVPGAQRLLREAGFEKVQVTGKAGDRGIDGVGLVRWGC